MKVIPILAQLVPGAGGGDLFGFLVPFIAIAGVMWWFMIRPQQQKQKEHQKKLDAVEKGDTVVSNGGLIGKVTRVVDDQELLVEVGQNVQVRMLRQGLADVRSKNEVKAKS